MDPHAQLSNDGLLRDAIATVPGRASQPKELLRCPAFMIRAVGTFATGALRHFHTGLQVEYGYRPPHVAILAVDSTDQPRLDGVHTLEPDCFINVADVWQVQDCLRRAREDPRVAAYMPELVTRLAAGDGAGGFPAAARFFYELKEPDLEAMFRQALAAFLPDRRPATANLANRHPLLQRWNMMVAPDGPIRVIYVASTTGGTVGNLVNDVILFKRVMRQFGVEAKIALLLTLPATASLDDVEAQRRRQLLFGRLQELTDLDAGKVMSWTLAGKVFSERDRFFDSILVLREPAPERLQEHQRYVGELLLQLISPLGMTIFSKAVDMVHVHTERGSRGQNKLLDLMNMVTVEAAAFGDVRAYARAALGRKALEPKTISNGAALLTNVLDRHRLTSAAVLSSSLTLTPMSIPDDLDGDPTGFLDYAEGQVRRQAEVGVKQLAADFERRCRNVLHQVLALLRDACLQAGPQGAFGMGQALIRQLETLAASSPAAPCRAGSEAPSDGVRKRLAGRVETQRELALSELRARSIASVRHLVTDMRQHLVALEHAADVFKELEIACEGQLDAILLQPLPEHVLLDRTALAELVRRATPACAAGAKAGCPCARARLRRRPAQD